MELYISDVDVKTIGLDSPTKERIVNFVHRHLGLASVVSVNLVDDPPGIKLKTASGVIIADREITKRIDN